MVSTDSSNNWNCLVDQLNRIDALGDVYEKKKRLRRIIVQLDAFYDGIRDCRSDPAVGRIDPVDVKRIVDKAKQDEEDIHIAEGELEDDGDSERRVPVNLEVVGDIDDLLGGLTLGDDDGPTHVQETTVQRRPVPGRRFKKVVRASGKQRRQVPARQDIDDDTGSVDGDHAGMPTRDDDDTTDEEAKRYAVPVSGRTRLTVDIPIQHEVIAQAQQRDPMAGHDRGSSGSTHAHCGARHVHNTDGISSSYDSDDSITSPAAGAIRTVVTKTK